jgi:hypothetical protein
VIYTVVGVGSISDLELGTRPDPSVQDFIYSSWDTIQNLYLNSIYVRSAPESRVLRYPSKFTSRDHTHWAEHDVFCGELEDMVEGAGCSRTRCVGSRMRLRGLR